ncbi:hypothetical protein PHLGIDRAFT_128399 [Phlebiopsis gigantea 11061_1 CR5-6]|uniref:Protein kinase domain-containing protein n=1 Tax=Phlebiopsis gigantea (strain 11061_1 CR5-6) TaxID=745531 RepID=A0A0C3PJF1_PHLG1|nr:hypothetical protein PHLGIDRAFT_128399 [Phlebiopsis gigantea 11061_1 CR5-6]
MSNADGKEKHLERQMYPHLLCILNTVATGSNASRYFRDAHADKISYEDGCPAFTLIKPDLVLDVGSPQVALSQSGKAAARHSKRSAWHDALCFIEVKRHSNAGPYHARSAPSGLDPFTPKPVVSQAADYARLHMSCRPFQLFSIGIVIFASDFTVSVFDRGGVMHSPQMKVFDDDGVTSDFIRVAHLLSCSLTEHELGLDPTVTSSPNADLTTVPSYTVGFTPHTPPCDSWRTIGRPIWRSYSLLGRGTVVWRVQALDADPTRLLILKSAWRHQDRKGEAEIYKYMDQRGITGTQGIASFRNGQDVVHALTGGRELPLSVNALRPTQARIPKDIILHRVVLNSVGKPLWEYDDPAHFLRALLAIVEGIRTLQQHNIQHRDISAGNILLSVDPRPGYEAFLTDFELAKIPPQSRLVPNSIPIQVPVVQMPKERKVPPAVTVMRTTSWHEEVDDRQGPEMTGTLQFMAIAMLENCVRHKKQGYVPVPHATHHDLESVVWVAEYVLFRRAYRNALELPEKDELRKEVVRLFQEEFGRLNPGAILRSRSATKEWDTTSGARQLVELRCVDEQLLELLPKLVPAVKEQYPAPNSDNLGWWRTMRGKEPVEEPQVISPLTCDDLKIFFKQYATTFHIF